MAEEQLDLFDGPDGRGDNFRQGAAKLPTHAILGTIGRVKVLGYHHSGYFHVLDNRDQRRYVHRDRLTFLP